MNADTEGPVVRGRAHYRQRRWADALEALREARRQAPLARADLERLAWSAALTGDDDGFLDALECLHQASVEADCPRQAARAAFWLGFRLFALGAPGRAAGWLARADRHLESEPQDCPERGYLLVPKIFRHLSEGHDAEAESLADRAAAIGESRNDADLTAIARNLQGRALLHGGQIERGLAVLDEVMVTVTSADLSPIVKGLVYCNVIATCQRFHALDRAREWTAALTQWCEQQPQLVTFTGNCHVHRSEVMQLGGDWSAALAELRRVDHEALADVEVLGGACYQEAELYRLRGRFDEAEAAYRRASLQGRDPQPGLALLRLAQGRAHEAVKSVERALRAATPAWQRAQLLPAFVEIAVAAGESDRADAAAVELERIAGEFGTGILQALAAQARGTVRLAAGNAGEAIEPLRLALGTWQRVGAPYLAARIRVLLGRACRALGDNEGADLEEDAARDAFEALGAAPDLRTLPPTPEAAPEDRHGLSRRELEVLRLVATGRTNKAIAAELYLSERTVDRHVGQILSKLDVPSRSAATAFAYEHGLI